MNHRHDSDNHYEGTKPPHEHDLKNESCSTHPSAGAECTEDSDANSNSINDNANLNAEAMIDNLNTKIKNLEQQLADAKDVYVRSQAEMQNTHKRNQEELKKTREYAISTFAKDLVAVKDYLEMALKDESGNFEMLKMGVDLTLKQLIQVFDNHKIKEITPKVLDKLDPHLHQAIETVEIEGQEANTVVKVMQKGYSLNERILRPAMVTVAK
ncbi:MAG: nucleotide exchange factor GrpE [Burkholderiales bacterium]|nr:nucleotide exchange factor GrpE [Burkholderiales bacterium]